MQLALWVFAGAALANEGQDLMLKLPAEKQQYALARLTESAGERCPTGTRAFFQGTDKRDTAHWNVQCSNGKAFVVSLYSDGSTKVLDCGVIKMIAGVECFKKFKR